jgi:RNA polymerase sigma-70 factor, ECF subfamily
VSVNTSKYSQHSDDELVRICQEVLPYNTDAYETLITRYEPLIFQFCLRYLRSRSEAEEVAQEVFLRVFHYIKRFEGRSSFKTWLMTIAQNQCSRKYKQLKRRKEVEEAYKSEELQARGQEFLHADQKEGLAMKVLSEMRTADREILSLRYLAGLTLIEVSAVLGISNSAAKMRHQRAASRFQELYKINQGKM